MEEEQAGDEAGGRHKFMDVHIYLTAALQKTDMRAIALQTAIDILHKKVWYIFYYNLPRYFDCLKSLFIRNLKALDNYLTGKSRRNDRFENKNSSWETKLGKGVSEDKRRKSWKGNRVLLWKPLSCKNS